MSLGSRDIHIAPVGFETERIYDPMVETGADLAVLVVDESDEIADDEMSKAAECRSTVIRELISGGVDENDIVTEETDLFNLYSSAASFIEIIQTYRQGGDDVYFNISTGSKLSAIGGMMACAATGTQPYYVHAEGYRGETITTGVADFNPINIYPLNTPHEQYIRIMDYIDSNKTVNKGDIVSFSEDLQLLSEYNRSDERNMYGPVEEEIIEPLKNSDYIREKPRGHETLYELTQEGARTLRIFRALIS